MVTPMDRKIVLDSDDELVVYAYRMTVGQADLPYVVQSAARPESTKHVRLYVDDLTIDGNLVNPGRDVTIAARRITFTHAATVIDVAGGDPQRSFVAGEPAAQVNGGFGADGAPGADAGPARPAGSLRLLAGTMTAPAPQGGVAATTVADWNSWVTGFLPGSAHRDAITAALTTLTGQVAVPHLSLDANNPVVYRLTVTGGAGWTLQSVSTDAASSETVLAIEVPALAVTGTIDVYGDRVPVSSDPFAATLRVPVATRWRDGAVRLAASGTITGAVNLRGGGDSMAIDTTAFADSLPVTKKLAFRLDLNSTSSLGFGDMTHVVADSLAVTLPDVTATTGTVMLELTHSGVAQQNSTIDLTQPGAVHRYRHAPRTVKYKIAWANPHDTAGGLIGDDSQGFPGLSPFTMWSIDFGLPGNEWLDLTTVKTVRLTVTGKFL
jgi:hypothetical protein